MFQTGVNRKRDSKALDACVRIEVLLGTSGEAGRPPSVSEGRC